MPLTVVTLSKVPPSLRGDLTKWMQEISYGVYVGNFNSRIRDKLWSRITENVRQGEATMSYACQNEIGYSIKTYNTDTRIINYDGLPLVLVPVPDREHHENSRQGFSNVSKMGHIRRVLSKGKDKIDVNDQKPQVDKEFTPYVVLDIETDGVDPKRNKIIEIGAIKVLQPGIFQEFNELINNSMNLSKAIERLTGISVEMLVIDGKNEHEVLVSFVNFIEDIYLVGYNVKFDIDFLNNALERNGLNQIRNKTIDLLRCVKQEKMYLDNFKLQTVLDAYGIKSVVPHRALGDAELIYQLSTKVNKFQQLMS